ncbi:MAG: Integrator complex subunit 9, partial [Paramarteilia canceri]
LKEDNLNPPNLNEKDQDISEVLGFDTETVSFDLIDILLISNPILAHALPFLLEIGFKGKIIATRACLRFLRRSLIQYSEFCRSQVSDNSFKKLFGTRCSEEYLEKVFKNSIGLAYNEIYRVFGACEIVPLSSGFCLGSCNWLLKFGDLSIGYLSTSSTIESHCLSLKTTLLKDLDLLISPFMHQNSAKVSDSIIPMLCQNIFDTLFSNHNSQSVEQFQVAILPMFSNGHIFDILHCFAAQKNSLMHSFNFNATNFYFICPGISEALTSVHKLQDWIAENKIDLLISSVSSNSTSSHSAFLFQSMLENGKLKCFDSVSEISQFAHPAIIFTSHPILKLGPVVDILNMYQENAALFLLGDIFLTFSLYYSEKISTLFSHEIKENYKCVIFEKILDTSLDEESFNSLIKELAPKELVNCKPGEVTALKVFDNSTKCYLSSKELDQINGPLAFLSANITIQSNRFIIGVMFYLIALIFYQVNKNKYNCNNTISLGKFEVNSIIKALEKEGFSGLRPENTSSSDKYVIYTVVY